MDRRSIITAAAWLGACAPDSGLVVHDSPPTAIIETPTPGQVLSHGQVLRLSGTVADRDTAPPELEVKWFVAGDRVCADTSDADAVGLTACEIPASESATITLVVVDPTGQDAEATVDVEVVDNRPPTVEITTESGQLSGTVPLSALVSDPEDAPPDLVVAWTDSGAPLPVTGAATDSSGRYSAFAVLAPGDHHLRALVTDTDGATAIATAVVAVVNSDQTPPRCAIRSIHPTSGVTGEPVTVVATGSDVISGPDALTATLSSDRDGPLFGPGPLDATGARSVTAVLSDGEHQLTLTVVDEAGLSCEVAAAYEVCSLQLFGDGDGDGFGDPGAPTIACGTSPGLVTNALDCDDADPSAFPGAAPQDDAQACLRDADGDGFGDAGAHGPTGSDCDDADPRVHRDAIEVCDGQDNDCDGAVDLADPGVTDAEDVYTDADLDGFGDPNTHRRICPSAATVFVLNATDCDDTTAGAHPFADEVCDGLDNDCDGTVDLDDPDLRDAVDVYADLDRDGFGDPDAHLRTCAPPATHVADDTDCDDHTDHAHPGAPERCDGLDNDCDGAVDTADPGLTDGLDLYADTDDDGFGDPTVHVVACSALLDGLVFDDTDCDDAAPRANPDEPEVCDGVDNDCDGAADTADSSLQGALDVYADVDRDGFGDPEKHRVVCDPDPSHVADATDCDDGTALAHPGGVEVCDGVDNDCDGAVDTADPGLEGGRDAYADTDRDGFGDPHLRLRVCDAPATHVFDATDCDDATAAAHPGLVEVCDGLDNDCDGAVDTADPGIQGALDVYADTDADGFGDPAAHQIACLAPPAGYRLDHTDCDDTTAASHPGAAEVCDGLDNDCDGAVDAADGTLVDGLDVYRDVDRDGFGDPSGHAVVCLQVPATHTLDHTDCDDRTASAHPGRLEICDGVDNDCNGAVDTVDPGLADGLDVYADTDHDGFGDPNAHQIACGGPPPTHVTDRTDCDDHTASAHPGHGEVCDGVDNDCDGAADTADPGLTNGLLVYADTDRDGFGAPNRPSVVCAVTPGQVADRTDCDDAASGVHPGANEVCDGVDNDCDQAVDVSDPGLTDGLHAYADADHDGFGDPAAHQVVCFAVPPGRVTNPADCDDVDPNAFPGAAPADHPLACMRDQDGDDYGDAAAIGAVVRGRDCADADPLRRPSAVEVCDGVDNNCDGAVDDADPRLVAPIYYPDVDRDGFGDAHAPTARCTPPPGFLATGQDCDDAHDDAYPGAPELCDGRQNNCLVPWTSDAGIVSRFSTSTNAWVDETARWAAGTASNPVAVSYTNPAGTRLQLCGGTWYVSVDTDYDFELTVPGQAPEVVLDGGGVHRVLHLRGPGTSTVRGVTIRNGTAILGGGLLARAGHTVVDRVHFRDNVASSRGGAIHANTVGSRLTVTNSTFTDNRCNTTGNGTAGGGAIHALRAHLTVTDSVFDGNVAAAEGGAVKFEEDGNYATIEVRDSTFTDNEARNGGAIYLSSVGPDEPLVADSVFVGNRATVDGGAVSASSLSELAGTVRLVGNTMSSGSAGRGGFVAVATPTEIRESTLTTAVGGCVASTAYVALHDVDLVGCAGAVNGGALRVYPRPTPTLHATNVRIHGSAPADVVLQFPADLAYTWPAGPHDFDCDDTCALAP